MEMSEGDIRREYNAAKYKKKQIKILAQLNSCKEKDIERILGISTPPSITERLCEEINRIDGEIKTLEEKYKRVQIALEVVSEMEEREPDGEG